MTLLAAGSIQLVALELNLVIYMAYMACYIYAVFEDMAPHLAALLPEQREHLQRLSSEGMMAAKQEISYAKHTLESAAKTLTTAVAISQHSWLRSTTLPYETRGSSKISHLMAWAYSMPQRMQPYKT